MLGYIIIGRLIRKVMSGYYRKFLLGVNVLI